MQQQSRAIKLSRSKKLKNKEVDLLAIRDEIGRKEDALKGLHVKLKNADDNATKTTNKTIQELKEKLAAMEKTRQSDEAKMASLKEERKNVKNLNI